MSWAIAMTAKAQYLLGSRPEFSFGDRSSSSSVVTGHSFVAGGYVETGLICPKSAKVEGIQAFPEPSFRIQTTIVTLVPFVKSVGGIFS
jgi:hypothetical protein